MDLSGLWRSGGDGLRRSLGISSLDSCDGQGFSDGKSSLGVWMMGAGLSSILQGDAVCL